MFFQEVLARFTLGSFAALALGSLALAQSASDAVGIEGGVPSGQAGFDPGDVKSGRTEALSLATREQVRSVQGGTDASILSVTSEIHLDLVGGAQVIVNFDLSEVVSLDGVSFVAFDAFNWEISADNFYTADFSWQLLYKGQALLSGGFGDFDSGPQTLTAVVRGSLFLPEMDPGTTVDGVRLIFNYTAAAETNFTTELSSINQDNALNWHFASCAFSSPGPHRTRFLCGLRPVEWIPGQKPPPWQAIEFDEPLSTNNLRYVQAGSFRSIYRGDMFHGTIEMQLLLNDGTVRTLDDWNSPSTLEPPGSSLVIGPLSLFLDDPPQDLWITGFRWRMHLAPRSDSVEVTPSDPFRLWFLYDVPVSSSCFADLDCDGEVAPFDLALLLNNWGVCLSCSYCFADLNGDGMVGPTDLAILLSDWGACE